jgi:hypothetical protein
MARGSSDLKSCMVEVLDAMMVYQHAFHGAASVLILISLVSSASCCFPLQISSFIQQSISNINVVRLSSGPCPNRSLHRRSDSHRVHRS